MELKEARNVVMQVVDLRKRWGIQVGYEDFDKDKLLDALLALTEHEGGTLNKDMLKLKQQLGAATSREKKRQTELEALREKVKEQDEVIATAKAQILSMTGLIKQLEAEVKLNKYQEK